MRRVTAALLMLFAVLIAAAPATSHAAPMAPVSAQGEDDSAKAQGDQPTQSQAPTRDAPLASHGFSPVFSTFFQRFGRKDPCAE
jgi:hypothetical protein